jgi:tRNA(His) 5'-end guanylyltransferase
MKEYENNYRIYLPKRMPLLIRIDGKAFHTFTKGMNKPFDEHLQKAMWETGKYVASHMMGCKLVYQQSDEISLLLTNYDKRDTESWFNNNLQKIVSVSASLATAKFNEVIRQHSPDKSLALFDARAWLLPKEEVINYFIWRQADATKNSISMVAQAHFPHTSLEGLHSNELQDKLMLEKGINWNDLPIWQKRGICIVKKKIEKVVQHNGQMISAQRNVWVEDLETPIFTEKAV